jgi:beta-glucosidase/6-phospho-beta-glucosidase/beta-galactosidase
MDICEFDCSVGLVYDLITFRAHFGLFSVDFKNRNRTRSAKMSADYYLDVLQKRSIENQYPNEFLRRYYT